MIFIKLWLFQSSENDKNSISNNLFGWCNFLENIKNMGKKLNLKYFFKAKSNF